MASTITAGTTSGTALNFAGDTTGILELKTNNGTTAVTIDTAQNVGIGTTSPQAKLAISAAGAQGLEFLTPSATAIGIQSYNRNTSAYIDQVYVGSVFTWTTGGVGERMRIDSSGNLLVGTSTSLGRLTVTDAGSGTVSVMQSGTTAGVTQVAFANPNGFVGSITTSGSSTAYNTSSDYRLKEDIAPMQNALGLVQQLKPVTYKWKIDGSSGQGFIAHELQAVVPDCVTGEKDAIEIYTDKDGKEQTRIKAQGIDTSFLVATLTAAIQELNSKVDAQALEIQALKGNTPLPAENT